MADAVIEMEARLKNFISGEVNRIERDLRDMGETSQRSFSKASSGANTFMNTLKGFLGAQAIMAAAQRAIRSTTQLFSESVKLYGEQVKAETQLQQALGYTSEALLSQASALQKVTTFGDEQTIKAMALIAMFVREEQQIARIIPLVQDLAAAKGMDLATAADLVSKTLGSSTNALQRYGINVEGAVGSSERLESLVRALERAFKRQAQAIAETGTGPLIQYESVVSDVKEELGRLVTLGLEPYVNFMKDKVLPVVKDAIKSFADWLTPENVEADIKARLASMEMVKRKYDELRVAIEFAEEQQVDFVNVIGTEAYTMKLANARAHLESLRSIMEAIGIQIEELKGPGPAPPEPGGVTPGASDWPEKIADAERRAAETAWEVEKELAQEQIEMDRFIQERRMEYLHEWATEHLAILKDIKDEEAEAMDSIKEDIDKGMVDTFRLQQEMIHGYSAAMAGTMDFLITATGGYKEELKPLLYAMAVMRGALSTVAAIQSVWESDLDIYAKIALAIGTGATNTAAVAAQISAISSAAQGTDFIARGPQLLRVGDNPTQEERVTVSPIGSDNRFGAMQPSSNFTFNINLSGAATRTDADTIVRAIEQAQRDGRLERFRSRMLTGVI